jgi:hypothetical protein
MSHPGEPVVLELAPLPREQIGPFLLLGVDKDANWARRVIWARKNQTRAPLEDINWARETISDPERRVRADCTSFNLDTTDGPLRRWCKALGAGGGEVAIAWHPFDAEKPLADHVPDTEVPPAEQVRVTIAIPEIPVEVPAVSGLLRQFVGERLDPWAIEVLHE